MYFVVNKAHGGGFFFTIFANNHEKLCHSEVYNSKQGALHAISIIMNGAETAATN